ncbi:MAG: hypothetical protein ACFFDI_16680, partial [Promethearchaeota archaeon]
VQKKMKAWEACYVVVYQPTGTKLKDQWIQAGFKKLSRFSWKKFEKQFGEIRPYSGSTPDWWLLRKEKCMISSVQKS